MKRTVISWILLAALLFSLLPSAAFAAETEPDPAPEAAEVSPEPSAEPGMAAFEPEDPAPALPFADVRENDWFYDAVQTMYALGLVSGTAANRFSPDGKLTAGQCAALSVRIYERYHGIIPERETVSGEAWYAPWMRAAEEYGIAPAGWDGSRVLTRAEALILLSRTLPEAELPPVRTCGRIPGVAEISVQYDALHRLYDAGILNGVDAYGRLDGSASVTRAQYLALLARLIDPAQRLTQPLAVHTGMEAFVPETSLGMPFSDVPQGSYYYDAVAKLYQMGLLNGTGSARFSPYGRVQLEHAVMLSVRVYELYHGLSACAGVQDVSVYLEQARAYGIVPEGWDDLTGEATRLEAAVLLGRALPESELAPIRKLEAIPDVGQKDAWHDLLLRLYRAGILNGADTAHTFRGAESIRRSELAAMFARLVCPSLRIARDLTVPEQVIRKAIKGYTGTWSVYLRDIDSGETVVVNNRRVWSASIIKLYVMGTVLDAIERGTMKNSDKIQSLLREMITWSSNSAWKSLAVSLGGGSYSAGMNRVNDWCAKNGYPDSGLLPGERQSTTSAADTGLFLLRVLEGTNVSAAASKQMLSLLKDQQVLYKIPAGVPKGVPTANKTGELDYVENDAAIIFAPFGTYILVVITENGKIREVKDLSSKVYAAMEQTAN